MRTQSRIVTPALAAVLFLGLAGGAWAQGTAPGATARSTGEPGAMQDKDGGAMPRSGQVPVGNPSQDTTGAIGHPKSNNSNGATSAPASR
ncbi:hypothetical protein ASG52_00025 [Methylobacterium sp. Leaf456]|uniref:hypothetical protein n=1 Tax=Methylobacterium sp. Leaf456 TaxID=1736382 RepID=UPI0006F6DD51|nr:hypothetical protein [Methylobacterium sp. Leaf456]KQT61318.1 hypothetical protein ASG52_00025 [Methylobacterium sp. Leaf456]